MIKNKKPIRITAAVLAIALLGSFSACTAETEEIKTSVGHLSRAKLYTSVEKMAEDSVLVIVGTVASDTEVTDIDEVTDFTLASVQIDEVLKSTNEIKVGDTVVVRQTGSEEQEPLVPLLKVGKKYLLYLTLSGLEGDLASQYYVTGANAGIYANKTKGTGFLKVQQQEGENLPVDLARDNAIR